MAGVNGRSYDCAIVGGGPAGLSAALVLSRARRRVLVVDGNRPRNRATYMSHGFITRDGIPPMELRKLAREDIEKYSNADFHWGEVTRVAGERPDFELQVRGIRGEDDLTVHARTVLLAAGLREQLPAVPDIVSYYGSTLFSCVHCDGWERVDQSLVVIGENPQIVDLAKRVSQWAECETVLTNGSGVISKHDRAALERAGIAINDSRIIGLDGALGQLEAVRLADGTRVEATGGFVQPVWSLPEVIMEAVPSSMDLGGVKTDEYGRSDVPGIYAAGDVRGITPSQLIIAAGEGARAGVGINNDMIFSQFE